MPSDREISNPSALARLKSLADPVFGSDLRSLAVFRIGLATVLLWDLYDRSKSVGAHYVDPGTLPTSALSLVTGGARFSIHVWLADSAMAQWALLALSFAAAFALLVGFHSRVAAVVSWALLVSLQVRHPLVSWEGADKVLRILLFWSMLAPVGARFSLDALRRARRGIPAGADWLCTPATALFVLQVCAIYWITGMAKTGDQWLNGQALAYTLRNDYFGAPFGVWMRQFDGLLTFLSHFSRYLELLGPFLLLVPWQTWAFRLVAMASFYGFHLGVLVMMSVGFFSPVSMVMWLPLLSSQVWDFVARWRGSQGPEGGARLATPRWIELPAAVLCLFMVASILASTVGWARGRAAPLPQAVNAAAKALRIEQHWPMFSPNPPPFDAWPVLRGRLADGRLVDPFTGGPVLEDQPESVAPYFPSFKWKIHFWWLMHKSRDQKQPHMLWGYLSDHLCREWNASHPPEERLTRIDLTIRLEVIEPESETDPVERWDVPGYLCS